MQLIQPASLTAAFEREHARLVARRAAEKCWAAEADLWKPDPAHASVIRNRLGWISALEPMRAEAGPLAEFAGEARAAGIRDVVLLGMGGSSLAPEVISLLFPPPVGKFFVLDSTDPASVLRIERSVHLPGTLFIVASKSGTTIETLSQLRYFLEKVRTAGVAPAGKNFIAITDEAASLDRLGEEHSFRRVFRNPADIGGRYSALSYFGLVPAALCGVDLPRILEESIRMREKCGPRADPKQNPALALGALLGAAASERRNQVLLVASPALAPLSNWIEQLVAESTGKEGKGIVPVAGAERSAPPANAEQCVHVLLTLKGDESSAQQPFRALAAERKLPLVEIELARPEQIGAEFFKWEAATAFAGAVLGINPFDEPNVKESKDNTARILKSMERGEASPVDALLAREGGIEAYGPPAAKPGLAAQGLAAVVRNFIRPRQPDEYLSLLAYVDRTSATDSLLTRIRSLLQEAVRVPVLLGYGPRYLHSIGQLYKGGPPAGQFLVITAADDEDAAIPGAAYTFGQLEMAQALGDVEALTGRGLPTFRLHLATGVEAGLKQLAEILAARGAAQSGGPSSS